MINTNWISRVSIATRAKVVAWFKNGNNSRLCGGKESSHVPLEFVMSIKTVFPIFCTDHDCVRYVAAIVTSAGNNYTQPVSIRTIDRNRGWTKRSMIGTKETRSSFSFSFQRDYVTLIARNAFDSKTELVLSSNSSSGSIRRERVSKMRKYNRILFALRSKLFSFAYHWEP